MRFDKLEWITARSCGTPKWNSFVSSLGWKGKILGQDIVLWNVPQKTNYWTKIADLGIIFSREKLPHTLKPVIASIYCGNYAVPFFMGHLVLIHPSPYYRCIVYQMGFTRVGTAGVKRDVERERHRGPVHSADQTGVSRVNINPNLPGGGGAIMAPPLSFF